MARNAIGMTMATASLLGASPCDALGVCVGAAVFVTVAVVGVKVWDGRKRTGEVVGNGAVSVIRPPRPSVEAAAIWEGKPPPVLPTAEMSGSKLLFGA